nr:ParB N-terminal domain-containing protein [Clostridia bacterium]
MNKAETIEIEKLPKIEVSKIKGREKNEFSDVGIVTLKQSIKNIGLINPISLRKNKNDYTIISGHRRFRAYKEILNDLKIEKQEAENNNQSLDSINSEIEKYSFIPAIVYEIVSDKSDLLGTDPKYITEAQEEEIYKASNLENRQISKQDLTKHIMYFYNMINNSPEFKNNLLSEMNKGAKRNATKLNLPKAVAKLITEDLGFSVAPSYIWQIITLIESKEKYPEYYKKAMKRIDAGDKVKTVYNDFVMAAEIYKTPTDDKRMKEEIITRLEKSDESVLDIYNEFFNIKNTGKERNHKKVSKSEVIEILQRVSSKRITLQKAIEMIQKL